MCQAKRIGHCFQTPQKIQGLGSDTTDVTRRKRGNDLQNLTETSGRSTLFGIESTTDASRCDASEISNNDIFAIVFSESASTGIAASSSETSKADGIAQCAGNRLAETLDIGVMFGLHHDASERLGARVTKDDATRFAERGFCFGKSAGHLRK
jgi:hypothetical protein